MVETRHPTRIFATVNGASTRLPGGGQQLIGGWSEDDQRARAVEYVRGDIASEIDELLRRLIQWDLDYPVNCDNGYAGLKELNRIIADAKTVRAKAEGRAHA